MVNYFVDAGRKKSKISKEIYGHFSEHLGRCIYQGIYVGDNAEIPNVNGMRKDVVEALKNIRIPVLRWPGGCFADEYHWKDGIGPKEARKKIINSNWGGVVEDNSFGTNEFFELCRQIECEGYVNANVGSGTMQEMQEWVEYITAGGTSPMSSLRRTNGRDEPWKLAYLGIGNENWGCGGNMTADYYANEYKRFQTYIKNYGGEKIYKIACGANADDFDWTETLMKTSARFMDGLSLHYYTIPNGDWVHKGSATEFGKDEYYSTIKAAMKMEHLVRIHSAVMDRYDPEKRVGMIVDEWGGWYDVEPGTNPGFLYQQNTMRDAILAGVTLNIFNKHSDRVKMANLAQIVNVLQSVILTEGDKMLLTPTYHVFNLYKVHQDSDLVESYFDQDGLVECAEDLPQLHESASVDKDGRLNITFCNISAEKEQDICIDIRNMSAKKAEAAVVTGACNAYNRFDAPADVAEKAHDVQIKNGKVYLTLPACSVARITAE
jgi:alpha-L-arabinofuranosidase